MIKKIRRNRREDFQQIFISVCIITYNCEDYITKAIEGVLAQKGDFRLELIIGEDCSTDRTLSICRNYREKYPDIIQVVTSEQNVGMIRNLTRVVLQGKGEYIAFCEGDDYWTDPFKLQKQIDFLKENPDYGLCYTNVLIYNQAEKTYRTSDLDTRKITCYEELLLGNYIPTVSVCCRKEYVDTFFSTYEDYYRDWPMLDFPMWLYIASFSQIKFLPEPTAVYRILRESASHFQTDDKRFHFARKTAEIAFTMYRSLGIPLRRKEGIDYTYRFFRQYYSWFISLKEWTFTKAALSYFMKQKRYRTLMWACLHLPFWGYAHLPMTIARIKAKRIKK